MQRYRESLINDSSFPFFRWLRNTRFHFRNGNENNRSLPILSRSFGFLRFRRHRLCKRSSLRAAYRCLRDFQGELKIERNFIFPFFILTDARSTSRCSVLWYSVRDFSKRKWREFERSVLEPQCRPLLWFHRISRRRFAGSLEIFALIREER